MKTPDPIMTHIPPFVASRYVVRSAVGEELNPNEVQQQFYTIASQMDTLVNHVNYLHRVIGDVNNFLQWVEDTRPEITTEYKSRHTADRIARRIEDGPGSGEVCVAAG